jgi:hypothetical protein
MRETLNKVQSGLARIGLDSKTKVGIAFLVAVGAAVATPELVASYGTVDNDVCTVKRLYNKVVNGTDIYLVATKECDVFKNVDDAAWLKWNSGSVQNALEEGSRYKIKSNGVRLGFMSWYPNIISFEKIEP